MKANKTRGLAVITGCDSGLGAALVRLYLDAGYEVIAGYLGPLPAGSDALTPLPLDLRSAPSIAAFADAVAARCAAGTRLAAAIMNAGIVAAGPVECVPLEAVREVFEVNFFGTYRLTQRLIGELIRARGRIAIVGSLAGRIALPFFSPYVSSKFALEGFADSLRREMRPFGVPVVLFEHGAVATPIWNASWARIRETCLPAISERYRAVFEKTAAGFIAGGNAGMPAEKAAKRTFRLFMRARPRARYLVSKSVLLNKLEIILPTAVMDVLIGRLFGMSALVRPKPERRENP